MLYVQVLEAFKCIEMCKDAIDKKAFNRANECFKRAGDLFKRTNTETLEATRKHLNQVCPYMTCLRRWCLDDI